MLDFPPVLKTALWVAGVRSRESAQPKPLVNDPFAVQLIGQDGLQVALDLERQHPAPREILRRIRLIDDLVERYVRERSIDMVIMAGTGLDARPYRLNLPSTLTWVELDYPVVTDWKNQRLADATAKCQVERIGVDLARPGALATSIGTRCAGKRTLVLIENLLHYLSAEATQALFRDADCFGAHTLLIADLPNSKYPSSSLGRAMLAELEQRNVGGRTAVDDVDSFASSIGFRTLESIPLTLLNDDPATWMQLKRPWWKSKASGDLIRVVVMEKV